jgi:hypothetical protein
MSETMDTAAAAPSEPTTAAEAVDAAAPTTAEITPTSDVVVVPETSETMDTSSTDNVEEMNGALIRDNKALKAELDNARKDRLELEAARKGQQAAERQTRELKAALEDRDRKLHNTYDKNSNAMYNMLAMLTPNKGVLPPRNELADAMKNSPDLAQALYPVLVEASNERMILLQQSAKHNRKASKAMQEQYDDYQRTIGHDFAHSSTRFQSAAIVSASAEGMAAAKDKGKGKGRTVIPAAPDRRDAHDDSRFMVMQEQRASFDPDFLRRTGL